MPSYRGVQAVMRSSDANPKNVGGQAIYVDMIRAFSLYGAKDDKMV